MKTLPTLLSSTIAILLIAIISPVSDAQVVPFISTGTNNVFMPTLDDMGGSGPFEGFGQTSHMGRTFGSGVAIFSLPDDDLVSVWTAEIEIVAANGDKLCLEGGGEIQLATMDGITFTAVWTGDFFVSETGSTGRFENATTGSGPLDVMAVNHPFTLADPEWFYDYSIVGDIDLGRRSN